MPDCVGHVLTIRRLHASTGMSSGLIPAMHLSVLVFVALSVHDKAQSPTQPLNHTCYSNMTLGVE